MEPSKPENTQQKQYNPYVRIFPQIQPDIYTKKYDLSVLTPDQKVACKLLALANQKFTSLERLLRWKLNAQGQIGHLLFQHRLALEAELEGQWKQADFYWHQVQIEIKALAKRKEIWLVLLLEIASEPGVEMMKDPVKVRQRLVDELLIDTHRAFYKGLEKQKEDIGYRAFVHIDYIQGVLNLSSLSGYRLLSILDYPWKKRINFFQGNEDWKHAIQLCSLRLKYFPESFQFQNKLVELNISAILSKLKKLKTKQSWTIKNFQFVDFCLWALSIVLFVLGTIILIVFVPIFYFSSRSLLSLVINITSSLSDFAKKLRSQVIQEQKILKQGIKSLEILLKKYPHNFNIYQGLNVLHNKYAIKLREESKFTEAHLHEDKASTYKANFKQGHKSYQAKVTAEENNNLSRVIIPVSSQNSPMLSPQSKHNKQKEKPFLFWFFSHQNILLKVQAVCASILLILGSILTIREVSIRSARNSSYQKILAEEQKGNYQEIFEEVEEFFTNEPIVKDEREQEVKQIYDKAFVNWFLQQEEQLDENDLVYLKRYKTFKNNSN